MPWRTYRRTDARRYITHMRHILGRRGSFLMLFGLVWIMQGIGALTAPDSDTYVLLADGNTWRGVAWITTGAIAITYSNRPQGQDAPGFLSLYLMAAFRVIAYGYGLFLWVVPGGHPGDPRGAIGMLGWTTIIIAILIIAGWREEDEATERAA